MFSKLMDYRHILSAACAAAVGLGLVAAPAEAAVDPIGKECRAATAAAKAGQPIPNLGLFIFSPNYNAIDGNLLRIYAPEKYKPYITQATDQWASATGGLIRFEYVNQPGYKVVTVREADLGGYVVGRVQGNVNNMELLLNPDILRNGYTESLVMTITHELGHAMGMAHSCDGALMKDGTNRGKIAKTPQPLDAQVLIQANNLAQYNGLPLTTTTAAPAPETSAPVETSVETLVEPSAPVESSAASSATEEAKPALPKPSSLAEADAMVRQTADEYVEALNALAQAQMSGAEVDEATAQFQEALDRYAQATENRDEYVAAHPDEAVESSTSAAPSQQPTSATETTTVEPTTTTATTTTASPVASVPSSSEAVAPKLSTSASTTTSISVHRTVKVTGEQKATTHRVQPTLTTLPAAETTTPASELPQENSTVTIDVTVPATPQNRDDKEALVGGSSVGILISIIARLLGALGAAVGPR